MMILRPENGAENVRLLKPKLRHDTAFLPSGAGAYVRNDETAFLVKGETAYRWIAALAPLLTGRHTVEELCERLSPAHQKTVLQLISVLVEKGFARDADAADASAHPQVTEAVQEQFRSQLNFIEHYADDPVRRFAAFRFADVLLVGAGEAMRAAAEGLLDNGLARLSIATADAAAPAIQVPEGAQVILADLGSDVRGRDCVAYCAEAGDLRELAALNSRCLAAGVPFLPLTHYGDLAIVGPRVQPARPCWMCLMLRLADNSPPEQAADAWRELATGLTASRGFMHAPVARMLGNAVAFELFRTLAGGMPGDLDDAVVVHDIQTLVARRDPLFAHPLCTVCRQSEPPEPAHEELDEEARYARGSRLVGRYVGLFQGWADDNLHQAPLKAAALHIGPLSGGRELVAYRLEHVMAARIAVLSAAACEYASGLAPRRLVRGTFSEMAAAGRTPVAPWTLSTWTGIGMDDAGAIYWMKARSLLSGEQLSVPVEAVRPAGRMFEQSSAGAAAGMSDAEVAAAGLLSMLAYLRLRDLVRGKGDANQLAPERMAALNPELKYLLASAASLGRPVRVLEILGESPVHVVLAMAAESPQQAAVGFGLSGGSAVHAALRDLLGQMQAADRDGKVANFGPHLLPDLDPRSLATPAEPIHSRLEDAPAAISELHEWLRRDGRDSLLVDTTPPDLRAAGFVTGRVLIVEPIVRTP